MDLGILFPPLSFLVPAVEFIPLIIAGHDVFLGFLIRLCVVLSYLHH